MDYIAPIEEFSSRIFRVHLKDATLDRERLDKVGILANPVEFHTPKLPGRGDVDWASFLRALAKAGYDGPVCMEVEEGEFEGSLAQRKQGLALSSEYLRPLFEFDAG